MKNNFLRSAVMHGLIIGLVLIVISLADWVLGLYGQNMLFNLLSYAVMIAGLVWAIVTYRNKEMGGYITYGQALSYGIVVSVVYSLIIAIFSLILTQVIDPTYTEKIMELAEQALLDSGIPESQIEMAMEFSKKFAHPAITFFSGIFSTVFISTIFSLIIAAVVKRNNPNAIFPEQQQF